MAYKELLKQRADLRDQYAALLDKVKNGKATAADDAAGNDLQAKISRVSAEIDRCESNFAGLNDGKAIPPARFGGGSNSFGAGHAGNGPFASFGEQLTRVVAAGMPSGSVDKKLLDVQAAASGLNESVGSDGGFLIQQDFSNDLLRQMFETGLLAKRCRRIQISGNSNSIKINGIDETSRASTRSGGIQSFWIAEAAEKTASKPKFRQITLELKKLIGLCYATDEVLQDASVLEAVIRDAFVAEFGFKIDDAIINGTGSGQPLGILNSGSLISVSKEAGQAAQTIVAENLINMYSRLLPGSEATAAWLINKNALSQLYTMSLAIGTGGAPIFQPAGGLSASPYNQILGIPVVAVEQCATLGTVGDIILADLQNGYLLADKAGGIQAASSIHVRFVYDEACFRFVYRCDGNPFLAAPITPYKGSATLGHFVALATRA